MRHRIPKQVISAVHDETFRVQYAETDDGVDLWLHGAVGDDMNGTDSLSVGQLLSQHRGKHVTMRVNSPGGLAFDGISIFNAIREHDGPTTGVIEGLAGSAASLAVLACDVVKAHPSAAFHPHFSLVMAFGHAPQIRDALAVQEQLDEQLVELYSEATGLSKSEVTKDLEGPNGDGTRFSAQEAKDRGYVQEVINRSNRKQAAQIPEHMMALRTKRLDLVSKLG